MTKDEAVILLCEHFSEGMVRTIVDAIAKDEALQLALDSMKEIIHWYAVRDRNDVFLNFVDQNPEIQKIMKSITAIKEALETKDEQRTWVGLTELDCVGWFGYDTGLRLWFETNKGDDGAIPLYKNALEMANRALETKDATVQVSPLEFVEMVMEKEHLIGQPIFWAQWPNEEKK